MAFFDGLDYLVSVLPKTSATDNIINSDSLKRLAPNSLVVNIGRGNAVDDGALLHAIRQGYVRAAVLDVFREEPLPQSDPYWHEPNVFVTSHTSAPTSERLVSEAMAKNLERFLAGQQPLGAYEQHKGY
jgi:glyoxylate/hydroxypyruvate reductase A